MMILPQLYYPTKENFKKQKDHLIKRGIDLKTAEFMFYDVNELEKMKRHIMPIVKRYTYAEASKLVSR